MQPPMKPAPLGVVVGAPAPQHHPQQHQGYASAPAPMYGYEQTAKPSYEEPGKQPGGLYGGSQSTGQQQVVQGVPLYPDCPQLSGRMVSAGYQDVWAAVLFAVQIAATIVWACVTMSAKPAPSADPAANAASQYTAGYVTKYVAAAVGVSVLMVIAELSLMYKQPRAYIIGSHVAVITLNICMGALCLALGQTGLGVVLILCAIIHAIWLYAVRNRIPFAAELLSTSVHVMTKYHGALVTSFGAIGVYFVYFVFYGQASSPSFSNAATGTGNQNQNASTALLVILLIFLFFWTVQVIFNVVHVTAAGTFATWYFVGDEGMPRNPSVASLRRAMTTSFGSICFGSLLVAILKTLHFIAESGRGHRNAFVQCVAVCILSCLEALLRFFNVYAFAHVAMYGTSYIESARQAWDLIKSCPFTLLINNNLTYQCLDVTSFFGALAVGLIFGFASRDAVIGLFCGLVALGIHLCVMRVIYSGIVTFFVCVAECPEALARTNPVLRQRIDDTIAEMQQNAVCAC